jgi:hypothetical protein
VLAATACAIASLGSITASGAQIRLLDAPKAIAIGQTWTATLETLGPGKPVVSASLGHRDIHARTT